MTFPPAAAAASGGRMWRTLRFLTSAEDTQSSTQSVADAAEVAMDEEDGSVLGIPLATVLEVSEIVALRGAAMGTAGALDPIMQHVLSRFTNLAADDQTPLVSLGDGAARTAMLLCILHTATHHCAFRLDRRDAQTRQLEPGAALASGILVKSLYRAAMMATLWALAAAEHASPNSDEIDAVASALQRYDGVMTDLANLLVRTGGTMLQLMHWHIDDPETDVEIVREATRIRSELLATVTNHTSAHVDERDLDYAYSLYVDADMMARAIRRPRLSDSLHANGREGSEDQDSPQRRRRRIDHDDG
jgi:hypothetical protein